MVTQNTKAVVSSPQNIPFAASFGPMGMALLVCAALFAGCAGGDPRLAEALENIQNPDEVIRLDGINTLTSMGEQAKPHAAKVVALLKDDSADVRIAAIGALVGLKDNSPEVVQEFSAMASGDKDGNVWSNALHALLDVGANEEFLKGCKEVIAGDDAEDRGLAIMFLGDAAVGGVAGAKAELEAIAGGSDADAATAAKDALKSLEE